MTCYRLRGDGRETEVHITRAVLRFQATPLLRPRNQLRGWPSSSPASPPSDVGWGGIGRLQEAHSASEILSATPAFAKWRKRLPSCPWPETATPRIWCRGAALHQRGFSARIFSVSGSAAYGPQNR